MLEIRDRRAAAFAALLAVLGVTSVALGLRAEPTTLPPVAAAAGPEQSTAPPDSPAATGAAPSPAVRGSVASPAARGDALTPPRPAATASPPGEGGMRRSEPVRLEIAAIGLRTKVAPVGLLDDGTLEVPPLRAAAPAGWYRHSSTPGETGAAVIIGHVDTAREGPAVFYRLRELKPGDPFVVRRADGSTARFEVSRVATYPKNAFPTDEVYGPVATAEVRLVTCGGSFDRKQGSYRDNVVVFGRAIR